MLNKLLYLEDDEQLAALTSRALRKREFDVVHFTSLVSAQSHPNLAQFTHALLDLKLDDGHALSFISELLEFNEEMRVVVLTGYSSIATAVQAIKLGAVNYLAKPSSVAQIVSAFEADESCQVGDELESGDLSLKRLEWEAIQQALAENNGNISATARQLNMHRRTLQRKLSKKPVKR